MWMKASKFYGDDWARMKKNRKKAKMVKKLTVTQKRNMMQRVLLNLVFQITHNSDTLLKGDYFNKKEGQHCIIGFYLDKEDISQIKEKGHREESIERVWGYIKTKEIKTLPLSFWQEIQQINDNTWGNYWTRKDGLTTRGKEKVLELQNDIKKPFTHWLRGK